MKVTCKIADVKKGDWNDYSDYYVFIDYSYTYNGYKGEHLKTIGLSKKEIMNLDIKKFIKKAKKLIKTDIIERNNYKTDIENIQEKINELKNLTFEFEMD